MHISSGGLSPTQRIQLGPSYQLSYAERIKREVGITDIAVGLITEAEQIEGIIVVTGQSGCYQPLYASYYITRVGHMVRCRTTGRASINAAAILA
ncbi:MAG: hypothetical protein ACR5LD_11900 [Symbiopectobacterium sp.]